MERKEFIRSCGYACLGVMGLSVLLEGCAPAKYLQVTPEGNLLKIARKDLISSKNNKSLRHVVVKTNAVNYPIVLYRFSDTDFSALLLECTHQGTELTVNGDLLSCPAHGSEFSNRGDIIQGPAEQKLKNYKVSVDNEYIFIHLI